MLIEQKLSSLESHMNWVIGGVTATIGVLMAIFAVIQFVYQRKIESSRLEKIKEDLDAKMVRDLEQKETFLKEFLTEKVSQTESKLEKKIGLMSADISRQYALACEGKGMSAVAFTWWLGAAAEYSENDSVELCNVSIKSAKECLDKVDSGDELLGSCPSIIRDLGILGKKRKVEGDLLETLFKEKLRGVNSPSNK